MPTINRASSEPANQQLAAHYRARIRTGELRPGNTLPSMAEIAANWDVSVVTVRAALDILRGEGLITSRQGKGSYVRQPPQRTAIRLAAEFSQSMKDRVLLPKRERARSGAIEMTAGLELADVHSTYKYDQIAAPAELAKAFDIPEGSILVQRTYEMVHKETGLRVSWSRSYIPFDLIKESPDLLDDSQEPWPGGHQHQLYTVGIEVARFERTIIAVAATPDGRQKWGMEPGTPLLCCRSKSIDINDRVVELSDAHYPADRTEISFVEHLNRWPADHPRYNKETD